MKKLIPLLPAIALFMLFFILPFAMSFLVAFYKTNFLRWQFVGMDNFIKLRTDSVFWSSVINTTLYIVTIGPAVVICSLFIASYVYELAKWAHDVTRIAFYLPGFAAGVVLSTVYRYLFMPTKEGLVNWIIGLFGIPPVVWFSNRILSVVPISIMQTMSALGAYVVIFLAALMSIDTQSIEAAQLDGAGWWTIKTKIILPQIKGTIIFLFLVSLVGQIGIFEWIYTLCPYEYASTIMYDVYRTAFLQNNIGGAAAKIGFVIVAVSAVLVLQRMVKRREI